MPIYAWSYFVPQFFSLLALISALCALQNSIIRFSMLSLYWYVLWKLAIRYSVYLKYLAANNLVSKYAQTIVVRCLINKVVILCADRKVLAFSKQVLI